MKKSVFVLISIAVITSGLSAGLSLSHVLEIRGKHELSANEFLHVQHTFYPGYAAFGAIAWIYGVVAGVIAGASLRKTNVRAAKYSFAAAAGFVLSLGIFFIFLNGYNQLIAGWQSDPPAGWEVVRNHWEMSHSIVFILGMSSFICFLMALTGRNNFLQK